MIRFRRPLSDIFVNVASVGIAFTSAMFAGYMIFYGAQNEAAPQRGAAAVEDPLDRRGVPPRHWAEDADRIDAVTTASIRDAADVAPRKPYSTAKLEDSALTNNYVLRAVFQGTALIEIKNELSAELWPATEGSYVPGAGKVIAIEKRNDHWQVVTTERTIAEIAP
jgi:hypothetical protein